MKNKKGETLLETLVSVAILAIITIPLLHPFVTSSKINRKSKILQDAATYSKSEMEHLKSVNVQTMAKDNAYVEYTMVNGILREVDDGTSSVVVKNDTYDVEKSYFIGQSSENYYFLKKNVDIGTNKADVLVEYTKDNEAGLSKIFSMNRSDCAYFSENTDTANRACEYFCQKNAECFSVGKTRFILSKDEAAEKMKKTVVVDVVKDETYGNISVTVTYTYDIGDAYTSAVDRYFTEEMVIFDNFSSNVDLSSIYIYYFPLYGIATNGRDSFVINNQNNLNLDIFLIAMNNAGTSALTNSNYKASVTVNEKAIANVNQLKAKIHSNIDNLKWNKFTSNALVNATHWQVTGLGNEVLQQLSYNVKVTLYKHDEDSFYSELGSNFFKPEDNLKICEMTSSALDNSMKETVK